jgi:hypothetical protein
MARAGEEAGAIGVIGSFRVRISSMRRTMDSAGCRMRSTSACICRAALAASGSFTNCRAQQAGLAARGQLAAIRSRRSWGVNRMRDIVRAVRRCGICIFVGAAFGVVRDVIG